MGYVAAAGAIGSAVGGAVGHHFAKKNRPQQIGTFRTHQQMTADEQAFQASLNHLFGQSQDTSGAGVSQLSLITPELYRQLGYEPTIQDNSAQIASLTKAVQDAYSAYGKAAAPINAHVPGSGHPLSNQQKAAYGQARQDLQNKIDALQSLKQHPTQITGLTRLDPNAIPAGSPGSAQNPDRQLVNTTLQSALAAMQGKTPIDPTLLREFDQQEAALRQHLYSQLGPGYETSTPGQQALADLGKRKAEALATYQRNLASDLYDRGLRGELNLNDLTSGSLEHLAYPANQQMAAGQNQASLLNSGVNLGSLYQHERDLNGSVLNTGALTPLQGAQLGAAVGGQVGSAAGSYLQNRSPSNAPVDSTLGQPGGPSDLGFGNSPYGYGYQVR